MYLITIAVLLGHPDGGITGKGDGRLTNFNSEAKMSN
jgi:hypothetical protein